MIKSRKWELAIGLILAHICAVTQGAEPNQPAASPELVFTTSQMVKKWIIEGKRLRTAAVLPTYEARLDVRWYFTEPDDPNEAEILATVVGKSLSDLQQGLVKTGQAVSIASAYAGKNRYVSRLGDEFPWGQKRYSLYAVSQADAKNMALALLEFLSKQSNATQPRAL